MKKRYFQNYLKNKHRVDFPLRTPFHGFSPWEGMWRVIIKPCALLTLARMKTVRTGPGYYRNLDIDTFFLL